LSTWGLDIEADKRIRGLDIEADKRIWGLDMEAGKKIWGLDMTTSTVGERSTLNVQPVTATPIGLTTKQEFWRLSVCGSVSVNEANPR